MKPLGSNRKAKSMHRLFMEGRISARTLRANLRMVQLCYAPGTMSPEGELALRRRLEVLDAAIAREESIEES